MAITLQSTVLGTTTNSLEVIPLLTGSSNFNFLFKVIDINLSAYTTQFNLSSSTIAKAGSP